MSVSLGRLTAVAQKEFREYRRTPFIIGAMTVLPLIFMIEPLIIVLAISPSARPAAVTRAVGSVFLLLLVIPTVIPATVTASSVVGEREQGTLEPLLTTPARTSEILLGKALSALVPAVAIAYILFALVVTVAKLFAQNATVASTLAQGPHVLAEALFAPLLAAWSIGVGTAISTRATDVRVAQQLGVLASLPPLAVTALVSFQVLTPTFRVAIAFGLGLLAIDVGIWRVVIALFNRERLITGTSAGVGERAGGTQMDEVRRIRFMDGHDHE